VEPTQNLETTSQRRPVLLVGVAVIAALLIAVAVIVSTRDVADLDPSTPEGVAQRFITASFDRDEAEMRRYLTEDLAARCVELDRIWYATPSRAVIVESTITGDRATVVIEVTTATGDSPFELSEYGRELTLIMHPTQTGWLIAEPVWPIECPPEVTP